MRLELVSLTGIKYAGDAYSVTIPTADGEITVYPNHMPLVSLAIPGMLTVHKTRDDREPDHYATLGGVVEVVDGKTLRILVDDVEHADELYEDEVRKAFEQAQKLRSEAKTEVEIEKAQEMVDRQALRLKVAEVRRRAPRRRG